MDERKKSSGPVWWLALAAALWACKAEPAATAPPAAAPAAVEEAPAPPLPGEGGTASGEQELRLPSPPEGHRPTGPEDRALLADLYVAFAAEPAGFADKVAALDPGQRRQTFGFLFCAAPRMLAAGQEGEQHGAPVAVHLPKAAEELIEYHGPRERARRTLMRQLAGEFVVVGRCIQSIDAGDRQVVDGILARQAENLEMMRSTAGLAQAEKWDERVRRVFPALFAGLLPEC